MIDPFSLSVGIVLGLVARFVFVVVVDPEDWR